MRAAVAVAQDPDDPLGGLRLTDVPEPEERPGWTRVRLRAATLNPHDLWTLRGVGHPADRLPIVLGCDGAGVTDDGREVVLYPLIGDASRGGGDETFDPERSILSEVVDGTLAEAVLVPTANLVPKPDWLSFAEGAALGVVWGTAYRMLFTRARLRPGDRVLVQGATGGVAGAAIRLASAAGARVYATSRSARGRAHALALGAHAAVEPGTRLPEQVDTVIETVGEATWAHSLRAVRPGGTVVTAGATSGALPSADLLRVFYRQLSILGSVMCTRSEFEAMLRMMETTGVRPVIDSVIGFDDIPAGYRRLLDGDMVGKIVIGF